MVKARYDAVADFYEAGFSQSDDPVTGTLLGLLEPLGGLRVLDVACGHGRVSRELARRGASVSGVDLSAALISKARAEEARAPLGIRYEHADIASGWTPPPDRFDAVSCNFGLSDIDDLTGCANTVGSALRPGGKFVFSILHPCFAGGPGISGSWPPTGSYHDEGWWGADGELSTLRRHVGANHRTLSTYLNTLITAGFDLDAVAEPRYIPPTWTEPSLDAARLPVFWVARCIKR